MAETKEKSVAELVTVLAEKSGLSKTQTKSFFRFLPRGYGRRIKFGG